ncbi:MAG: DinB family protein [bacterium]
MIDWRRCCTTCPRRARAQLDGSWSILQNAGHLGDVEELWTQRVDDLRARRAVYAPADSVRCAQLAEAHQAASSEDVLRYFAGRRAPFLAALASADEPLQRAEAFHERLRCPMRLVDLAQFVAEHDFHHLLRIRVLRGQLGVGAGG